MQHPPPGELSAPTGQVGQCSSRCASRRSPAARCRSAMHWGSPSTIRSAASSSGVDVDAGQCRHPPPPSAWPPCHSRRTRGSRLVGACSSSLMDSQTWGALAVVDDAFLDWAPLTAHQCATQAGVGVRHRWHHVCVAYVYYIPLIVYYIIGLASTRTSDLDASVRMLSAQRANQHLAPPAELRPPCKFIDLSH
jgi:hypothetical protein